LSQGQECSIDFQLDRDHVRLFDPSFAKVFVSNPTNDTVQFDRFIGSLYGTIEFEMRLVGQAAFTLVPTVSQNASGCGVGFVSQKIGPNSQCVSPEMIVSWPDEAGFLLPGKYEVRVVLHVGKEILAVSATKMLTVEPIEPSEWDRRASAVKLVGHAITLGAIPARVNSDGFMAAANSLDPSSLKTTLMWLSAAAALRDAREAAEVQRATKRLESVRSQLDPIAQEYVALVLARQHAELEQPEGIVRELGRLKGDGRQRRELEEELLRLLKKRPGGATVN
jgi:hypothetical protein